MPEVAGTRIWYQSSIDPDADRACLTRLQAYLGSVTSPGCRGEVFGILGKLGVTSRGKTAAAAHRLRLFDSFPP